MSSAAEALVDAVGQLCWAQEQGEKLVRAYLEVGRLTRTEGRDLAHRIATQIRQNQEEMQRWVSAVVEMSMAALRPATVAQFEELTRKVDALTRQIEALRSLR
jgi:polyhydroxyalkanoate synthesis regulator phasin